MNNQSHRVEVDTEAAVSLAPEATVTLLLSATKLKPSSTVLKSYTGKQVAVKVAGSPR